MSDQVPSSFAGGLGGSSFPVIDGVFRNLTATQTMFTNQIRKFTAGGTLAILSAGGTPLATFDDGTGLFTTAFAANIGGATNSINFRVIGPGTDNRMRVSTFGDPNGITIDSIDSAEGTLKPLLLNASNVRVAGGHFCPAQDTAAAQANFGLFAGTGVPNNANGVNGDYYFRGDTPGTVNQRLYVRSAGAWVGII